MASRLRFAIAALIVSAFVTMRAQDPLVMLPDAYKLSFENDWVKVVRVHYAPHVKLPTHAHTELAAAYVYLNDSGPVVFGHHGVSYGAVTRPPTRAGMFRLYRAVKEDHEVENRSELPSDFLRIEFKTEPLEAALLRGRFAREPMAAGKTSKLEFENAQLRVTRFALRNGEALEIKPSDRYPSLLVGTGSGTVQWVEAGQPYRRVHDDASPSDLLRFELKTGHGER
jgi:hypothetical protein